METNITFTLNPFAVPADTNLGDHTDGTFPAFAALRDPDTHAAAMDALLTFLRDHLHNCCFLLERHLMGYLDYADIEDKSLDEDLHPLQYMGLSMEEAEMLFGPPDPDDPVIVW